MDGKTFLENEGLTCPMGGTGSDQSPPRILQVVDVHAVLVSQRAGQSFSGFEDFLGRKEVVDDEDAVPKVGLDLFRRQGILGT